MKWTKRITRRARVLVSTVLVIAIVVIIILSMKQSVNKSIYVERQNLLSIVTQTSANIVNQNIDLQWDFQQSIHSLLEKSLRTEKTLENCIEKVNSVFSLGEEYYFVIDENGKYFSSDGEFGKLTDFSYYSSSTPDRMTYLSTLPHMDQSKTFLILRERLKEPAHIHTAHGDVLIKHLAFAHDMTKLETEICDLFPGSTNVFIHDEDGAMLYKKFGIRMLMDGFNVFAKMKRVDLRYGENPDELIRKVKNRESVVMNMDIAGENFYYCSSPLAVSGWSIAFVVQTKFLSNVKGDSFNELIIYISLIAGILGAALMIVLYSLIKQRVASQRLKESQMLSRALAETSKAKTDFLANMSHDIRTPINGIMGMTAIAMSASDNEEKVRECLRKIDSASHHLLSLVNDVLDMSRIESGKTAINTTPADIRTICENSFSIIKGQLSERDLEFKTEINVKHPKVFADELHLRQVFINILSNAVKFTRDGGKIWFRCSEVDCDDQKVKMRFEIKDTGIGMSPEFLTHIFEPFAQEESRGRSSYKGTGLGMAICKQLVELMDGTIQVDSILEKGTTFLVEIVFTLDKEEHKEVAKPTSDADIKGVKILLVEDNELNMEIAVEILGAHGAIMDTAQDGLEALQKFTNSPAGTYDIILMDIMMPRMNGLEATKAIRALDRADARQIPILAMTANAFDDDVRATQEAGMNAHLSKPIDIKQVISTIAFFC